MQRELKSEEIFGEEYVTVGNAEKFFDITSATFKEWREEFGLEAVGFRGKGSRKFIKKDELLAIIPKLKYHANGKHPPPEK